MYRLIRFKAKNLCGFWSGLGRKTVDIDLTPVYDKDVIAVLGENGTGKSTFLSMIHPVHIPSDKRTKFIVEGKEGEIVREYLSEDGTRIITRAIYTPKKDGHTAKLYFGVKKDGEDEIEMNPSGNVTSYNELLYTYMGVNKDFVSFASYNDLVRGIVDMTDTERKLNVASLIPNTKRFETAYNIINDKYKELRTIIRNISSKISQLSDKDELEARVKRLADALYDTRTERDKALKKSAKLEGQIKEMTRGKSLSELEKSCRQSYSALYEMHAVLRASVDELKDIISSFKRVDTNNIDELIKLADELCEDIPRMEVKYAKTVAEEEQYRSKSEQYRKTIDELNNEIVELQATLFSLRTQDVEDLKKIKAELQQRLDELQYYDPSDHRYDNLSFPVASELSNRLSVLETSARGLLDHYGEIFSSYYTDKTIISDLINSKPNLLAAYEKQKHEIEMLSARAADYEHYRKLQYILEKRPSSCVDDSCPFIADALQWKQIEPELNALYQQIELLSKGLEKLEQEIENVELAEQFKAENKMFKTLVESLQDTVQQYSLSTISIDQIVRELSSGGTKTYDAMQKHLQQVCAILSEKQVYDDIVNNKLGKIDNEIRLAESSQVGKDMIERQMQKAIDKLEDAKENYQDSDISIVIIKDVQEHALDKLTKLKRLRELSRSLESLLRDYTAAEKEYKDLSDTVGEFSVIQEQIDEYKKVIKTCDAHIAEYEPALDKTRYMLRQLGLLKMDEARETKNFMVVDIMRSIIMPGKGIWKEAIDIYMSEINLIANQVLQNTFGGDLMLEPFELTDKSFFMPYVFNGNRGPDISFASSSQRATVATAISMAIISKMVDKYSTITLDEFDATLSPTNKEIVTEVLVNSMKILGIGTAYVITHNPENYEKAAVDTGYIVFPGGKLSGKKHKDYVMIEPEE